MKALLVSGSRDWHDKQLITQRLIQYPQNEQTYLMHGGCKGADTIAGEIGKALGFSVHLFPADWDRLDKAAGPNRNNLMLQILVTFGRCGFPMHVEAFPMPQSKGTYQLLNSARELNEYTRVQFDAEIAIRVTNG